MDFKQFKEKYQKVSVEEYPNKVPKNVIVSVCVQTYQHANYIKKCLDSILAQETDFDFEILVGEDDSNDNTRKICLEYAIKYPNKIRLFLHSRENNIKINNSPTGRFNTFYNFYSSKGKYIAICEGDDYWIDATKLQKQVDAMVKCPDINICGHPSSKLNDSDNTIIGTAGFHGPVENIISPENIIARKGTIVPMQSIMIRKLQFGDLFNMAINTIGLHGILIIYASIPNGCLYLPDDMAVYRVNSTSSIMSNHILSEQSFLNNIISKIELMKKLDVYYNNTYTKSFHKKIDQLYYSILRSPYTSLETKFKYFKWRILSMENMLIGIIKRINITLNLP